MNRIIYIVGLVVIVLAILGFLGLRWGRHFRNLTPSTTSQVPRGSLASQRRESAWPQGRRWYRITGRT